MQSLPWNRADLIERVRRDLWRYITPAASVGEQILQAAALLQMRPSELRTLGSVQFLVTDELGQMLDDLPFLLRRLATTTTSEEEWSVDRIRGSIQWGRTIGLRNATGLPTLYVTAPSRRAYQTPENEVLVTVLDEAVAAARRVGWIRSESGPAGALVRRRAIAAERWRQSRMLLEVERRPVTPRSLSRARAGRYRTRYSSVLAAYSRYLDLIGRTDARSIRAAVETLGLATTDDPTLFELYVTFELLTKLKELGWNMGRLGLFSGALRIVCEKRSQRLTVWYQSVPRPLTKSSKYRRVQVQHGIPPGSLRPDLVLHLESSTERWFVIEIKGGHRAIRDSARAATFDLLAYGSAFADVLSTGHPYGLGVAWGASLTPALGEDVLLCSPDHLLDALELLVG